MVAFRSHLFNALFYLNLVLWLIPAIVTFVLPRKAIIRYAQAWGRFSLWLLRLVVGTRVELRGLDRIPPGGLLIASKHQSFLETFTLVFLVDDPVFILKRELQWIPIFGWLTVKAGMIPVRRGGATAFADMNRRAREEARHGRQFIIFPEGTRRAPGAPPDYKKGVAHLYRNLGLPCLPVGLNSGVFWPRRQYIRRPGTVVIEFGEVIPAGLGREEFLEAMTGQIESISDRLLAEAGGLPASARNLGGDGI
ncbi:lysophospholipid acyltransferase family protein [Enterovirga sp.]|uniref:lysophospholipid acyltransferase family protein n=1 Tax=Enterovirga sp. TaxID=2026350 RepID=UPI002CA15D36|nr:lysophospholipid acyltransferase family protein [Enterovirga sp.]HMO28398.1 lysophospholipid acyltransferase family protein [Enterovirga sp.]